MMYREPIKLYYYEVFEYDRKSRMDDPLLSVEEVLEKHSKILEDYAIKNLGGPILPENKFKEIASGETIKSRPEMRRLLKAIENPKIKAVLVVDVQRLSRGDLEDAGRLIKLLRYTNTYVITPMKIYDLRDEYDRDAFERELKRGNEYLEYFKKIQERGRLLSVKEGNYIGSAPPYGFDRIKKSGDSKDCWTLTENKEEADVVRMIFDWYCNERVGVKTICRRLEDLGIKTKNKKKHWSHSVIYYILENVHYIGKVRWNWRKAVHIIEDQEIKKMRPKAVNEYLVFDGKHDPIISEELFNKAQEIIGSCPRVKRKAQLRNPFSGIMFCKCGASIGYNAYNKGGKPYSVPKLVCNNQIHCRNGSVLFSEAVEYICDSLRECIADFEVRIKNNEGDSVKLHQRLITNLEKKMKELEEKEMLQWDAQYDPDPDKRMPEHVFKRLNEKLRAEKEEIKDALCKAKESAPQPVDYEDRIMKFTDALNALENPEAPVSLKNQYLKDIIERIEYERPELIRITKKNADKYKEDIAKGLQWHSEPFTIRITLR